MVWNTNLNFVLQPNEKQIKLNFREKFIATSMKWVIKELIMLNYLEIL